MRFAIALLVAALAGCTTDSDAARTGKIKVVATTGMVADLAKRIGGDRVEVTGLMGAGVDPHLYEASPDDVDKLRAADLVLYSGRGLEGKMGDILVKLARSKPVVAVTETIPSEKLLEPPELEGHYDPHVWFDVALWAEATHAVADAFAELEPSRSEEYLERGRRYHAELLALHAEVKQALAAIPKEQRVLITSHDAFRYFGRAYDVDVKGLQGISTAQDAGVRDVQDMVALIVKRKIKAVFTESSVNTAAIEAVRKWVQEKGHEVALGGKLFSDAMGDEPPEDTYVGMVRHNVSTIVKALR